MVGAELPIKSRKVLTQETEAYLGDFVKRHGKAKALRKGTIVLRLTGAGGG